MTPRPLILLLLCALLSTALVAADVEYSTTGAMDTPATLGGDRDGWGTEFITRWHNDTGADVHLDEFGWPCGGWWAQFWYVWITDTLPDNPWTLQYYDSFVPTSEDDTEWPPSVYSYIDVSEHDIVIPAGATMYFGYANPGMGGQIQFNGVETWSWLDEGWDMDGDFNRTAVMQFEGSFTATAVPGETPPSVARLGNHPNPFNPSTTISFELPRASSVRLDVLAVDGRRIARLADGHRDAGRHEFAWSGIDAEGRAVPSGVYLARLITEQGVEMTKLVLAK